MRKTVTIDPDTMVLLREETRRSLLSFKEVLNQAIRRSLLASAPGIAHYAVTPIFAAPFPPEFSSSCFNLLADELDDNATVSELSV